MSMSDAERSLRTRLEADRRDLLDLTLRNPLLNYQRRARGFEFPGVRPAALLRALVGEGRALDVVPGLIVEPGDEPADLRLPTGLEPEPLHDRLLATYYAARTAAEEQGVNTLSLALGMLHWTEESGDSRVLRAPLLLVPVTIERAPGRERFKIRHDGEDPEPNLSLAERLRTSFGLTLPEWPEDEPDLPAYCEAVAAAIAPMRGWSVDPAAAALGFFSFGKYRMYRDLDDATWPPGQGPSSHPLLRALLGDGFHEPPLPDEDDPVPADAVAVRTVLDADGTQTQALRDIAGGRNLVVQGPPGTGKSQTIANAIADAVGRGQKVLFVAEKRAALEVVKRRLDAAGLGEVCLELHSHKQGKRAILDQLRRALAVGRPRAAGPDDLPGRRDEARDRLDAYSAAQNSPIGASGVTPHEAIGVLVTLRASLGGEPPAIEIPGSDDWTGAEYRRRLEVAERLQGRALALIRPAEHPFFGCRLTELDPGSCPRLAEPITTAGHAAAALQAAGAALAGALRTPEPENRPACQALVRVARRVAEAARWRGVSGGVDWIGRRDVIRGWIETGRRHATLRRQLDAVLLPSAWDRDVLGLRCRLNAIGRRWWRWAVPAYREARVELASLCRHDAPGRLDDQLALLDQRVEAESLRSALETLDTEAAAVFGRHWRGAESDWSALAEQADGLFRLQSDAREGSLPPGLLEALGDGLDAEVPGALARGVEAALVAHHQAIARLARVLALDEPTRFGRDGGLEALDFAEQRRVLEAWEQQLAELPALVGFNRLAASCRDEGLGRLAELAESWPEAPRRLVEAFRYHWHASLLRRAERERPELCDFEPGSHDRTIRGFRELDAALVDHDRAQVADVHWRRVPRHEGGGQLAVLRRELAKKARHLPARQLMARAGRAIQAATPVFLMSPLSVAAYLPPDSVEFDLVLFDEASQVRPVDALGALLRARQAVVVGDSRQLPPTGFFERLTAGDEPDDDEEHSSDVESILGLFSAQGAPERMLRWHYRSRHESLIAVSNCEFYDDRLVVFPGPDRDRRHSGLVLHHLPGTHYDRGRTRSNPGEADAVARAALAFAREQLRRPPAERLSLGVAAFSLAQRQAIDARLERLRRTEPGCEEFFAEGGAEPFFVKNLETVQGDERDVMFLSLGYGRTAEGTVALNFGPLNAEGGERRLNVLITRARVRCEVFTNLRADDLDTTRTRARGLHALKAFLAYAETGRLERGAERRVPAAAAEPTEALAPTLALALQKAGYEVVRGPGAGACRIDLAVLDPARPERFLLGLRGDGPSYHEARAARDRDRLLPDVLRGLGWTLRPLWSPAWADDPDGALRRLLDDLATQKIPASGPSLDPNVVPDAAEPSGLAPDPTRSPDGQADDQTTATDPEEEDLFLDLDAPGPSGQPRYRTAALDVFVGGRDLRAMSPEQLVTAVEQVVQAEGPVHADEIARRLADASGLKRLAGRALEVIESAIAAAVAQGRIRRRGDFLWREDAEVPPLRDRSALPAAGRRLELIAPEEQTLAVVRAVGDSFGLRPEELATAAARLLGLNRVTDEMRRRFDALAAELQAAGQLVPRGEHLILNEAPAADRPTGPGSAG